MDGVTLVAEARAAGLTLRAEGDTLVVRGPRAAGALARTLLERKAEVLAVLATALEISRSRVSAFARSAVDEPVVIERANAMRVRHPYTSGAPLPFLTARDVLRGGDECLSCGEPVAARTTGLAVRCALCAWAGQLVIDEYVGREEVSTDA